PPTAGSRELLKVIDGLGVTLEPMHPGTDNPQLVRYFYIEIPEPLTAEQVIAQLRQSKAIEAAYQKPPDALP
ncbi:MAG: hypothetical protein ACE5I1_30360, partial [bacterium]